MTEAKNVVIAAVAGAEKAKRSEGGPKGRKAHGGGDVPYDLGFPDGCPVEPLGFNGDDVYFLDQARQLRMFKAKDLNQGNIRSLFGDMQDLKFHYWPRFGKPDDQGQVKIVGWRPEQAADCLYAECRRRGHLDILDRVRGPGGWRDEDGQIIMHCGDLLYHGGETLTPRQIGRHVYPSAPSKPRPSHKDGTAEAQELLELLKTWNWRRPDVDPYLLLGWIGAAILGGALRWRPLIWITGDKATGKSTLHEILKEVMGPGGLIAATDASAAGLWQTVGHASLPVALDEIEAEADNRKAMNVIKLARQAASGGQTLRGGSDHSSSSFTVRSCFLFSSILIPPMLGQDVSRMGVLQLDDLPKGAVAPALEPRRLAEIGLALRGRLLRQWPRLQGLLETWKMQLAQAGHGGRGGDQFGTLLACADILTSDYAPDSDYLVEWATRLDKRTLAEGEGDIANHERCLSFLLTAQLDLYRSGEKRTVGSWILQAAGRDPDQGTTLDIKNANRALGNAGLMVQDKPMPSGNGKYQVLLVANDHQGLSALFRESIWAGAAGSDGVWVQAMRRVKGNFADQQRFNGLKKRCTAIPLDEILGGQDE